MTQPDFSTLSKDNIVAFLGDIFDRRGGEEYLGEPVTMAEHMLQGATFAEEGGLSEEIIVSKDISKLAENIFHAEATSSTTKSTRCIVSELIVLLAFLWII